MRIKLSQERKDEVVRSVVKWFSNEFDEELSSFRAEALVDFMLKQIGPSQYNQAITDARKFMLEKLDDLDSEFFEAED